ncbi:MAG: CopG family transcriptional regulator [Desulfobacterales bacterium]|uniref:CopG family transcriptional regulator n=1 Tax=Candidatus Desulfatibia profunda TaxID=2841695 RepID=A0A8J6TMK3_9BACT|nr:CopG family transcriptional regulator [Candidatus Desulfatibia profunda]MBL7178614.1 CopG family transcriptional regulator [Desulfobacterales bacterium]
MVLMKNITITLEEKVASWARIRAAERETSVSRLVGEMLKEKMLEEESYGASMQHYLSKPPVLIKEPGTRYPTREKLHER